MKKIKEDKRGLNLLTENIIFLVLNLVFISILMVFIIVQLDSSAEVEEMYAKKVAMMIDGSEPGTFFIVDFSEVIKEAKKNEYKGALVFVTDNIVHVKTREDGGYSYSFFNDVSISGMDEDPKKDNYYYFQVGENE